MRGDGESPFEDPSLPVDELIRNYFDFIINKEYRLADGTFARNRPQHNTLWLDDMFMGIPAVAQMSYYDKGQKINIWQKQ